MNYHPERQKLCCYVDETGQDTRGRFFLVVAVVLRKEHEEAICDALNAIEVSTLGHHGFKWSGSPPRKRMAYIERIAGLTNVRFCACFRLHQRHDTREYTLLTAATIASVLQTYPNDALRFITIDGLNAAERSRVATTLRQSGMTYKKVRGAEDEATPLLRLADMLAGFLRAAIEGRANTQTLRERLESKGIVRGIP